MDDNKVQAGALETPQDAGKGPAGVVARWLLEIELASKEEEGWRKAGRNTVARYRDEKRGQREERKGSSLFNILFSNTEIQRPALYSNTPRPDIRRRHSTDQDVLMRAVAEGMERAANYTVDVCDLDHAMDMAVTDYLLPGRAITRVRYTPTKKDDQIAWEKVEFEHVPWQRFRRGPGGTWGDVKWIAFEHFMTRKELERWPAGKRVELDVVPESSEGEEEDHLVKRGRVWEIWDKDTRQVIYIAPSVKDGPLGEDDDPLSLKSFYPIPRPLYAVTNTETLVPVEADRQYRDQQEELDEVTHRIRRLTAAMKARGIYDATLTEMSRVIEGDDNELIASEGAQNILAQTGTLERHVWFMPVEAVAKALAQLYIQREAIKQTIYEITGLSDIMRGATDANETLGAQKLKAQTGSLRMQRRQREVQRYARDLIEMACEIMAEHFQADTLSMMIGEQVTPEAMQVLRNQGLRDFSINIETDSTISVDQQQDREDITALLGGITEYMAAMAPAVQGGLVSAEAAKTLLMAAVRRFRLGREVEEAFETQGNGQQIDPAMVQQIQQQAMEQAMAQAEQAVAQEKAAVDAEGAKVDQAKAAIQSEVESHQSAVEQAKKQIEMDRKAAALEKREALAEVKQALQALEAKKLGLDERSVNDAREQTDTREESLEHEAARLDAFHEQMATLSDAVKTMAEAITQGAETQQQTNEQLLAALTAERELVRDKQGRAVSSRLKVAA